MFFLTEVPTLVEARRGGPPLKRGLQRLISGVPTLVGDRPSRSSSKEGTPTTNIWSPDFSRGQKVVAKCPPLKRGLQRNKRFEICGRKILRISWSLIFAACRTLRNANTPRCSAYYSVPRHSARFLPRYSAARATGTSNYNYRLECQI